MAVRRICRKGEEILNKKCREVTDFNPRLWMLLDDMKETLRMANGAGIAAPQVGVMRRAAIVMLEDGKLLEIINPKIISVEGDVEDTEGCLSVPGIYGIVKRPAIIKLKAQDRNGNWFMRTAKDYTARTFCHEIDHLSGVLFTDLVVRYIKPEELE